MRTVTCDMCGDSRDAYVDRWRVDKYKEIYFNNKHYDFCPKCSPQSERFIAYEQRRRQDASGSE